MARPLRIDRPGLWYHVTARRPERKPIFREEADRLRWLGLLPEFVAMFQLKLHGYVMMRDHFHLLIETRQPNLSAAMQWLQTSYSMWFNHKYDRVGPLLQGRFNAVVVEPSTWGLALSRYMHLNPVRIKPFGLRKQPEGGEPRRRWVQERLKCLADYRWSSYRAYVGREPAPKWLTCENVLELAGKGSGPARRRAYEQFVQKAVREGLPSSPWEHLIAGLVLGSLEFVRQVRKGISKADRDHPQSKQLRERPDWAEVVSAVEAVRGLPWKKIKTSRGDWGRNLAWHFGRTLCGLTLRELGELSGGTDFATVAAARARLRARLLTDASLRKKAKDIESRISKPSF